MHPVIDLYLYCTYAYTSISNQCLPFAYASILARWLSAVTRIEEGAVITIETHEASAGVLSGVDTVTASCRQTGAKHALATETHETSAGVLSGADTVTASCRQTGAKCALAMLKMSFKS
jgi:hypothetical protein